MTRYRNFMVALINPRALHNFNERYHYDHFGTRYLNGLRLLWSVASHLASQNG
jgi:hypothetical protein